MFPRLMGRIQDDFWANFIFIFNIGFSFIATLGRYHLGDVDNKWQIILLTGQLKQYTNQSIPIISSSFTFIFCTIAFTLLLASCVVIVRAKIIVFFKERKQYEINLGLEAVHSGLQHVQIKNKFGLNNAKYNKSIFDILVLIIGIIIPITIVLILTICLPYVNQNDEISYYQLRLYLKMGALRAFHRLAIPATILYFNPDMRKFMLREIKEFCECKT